MHPFQAFVGSVFIALLGQPVLADDSSSAETVTPTGTFSASASTNIPFFSSGHLQCATVISCEGLGSATVTTITKTLPGFEPSGTTVTISPSQVKPKGTHTVIIVPPGEDVGVPTVTKTLTPGETVTETAVTSLKPGHPGTVIIIPGGPNPTKTVTVTSTFTAGHGGDKTITLGPTRVLPGEDATITIIPPKTSDVTMSQCSACCPPQQTVTITQQPEIAPVVNITKPDGAVEQRKTSQFPCSKDDLHPCRGTQMQGWTVFQALFGGARKWDGNTYPNPWQRSINFADDTILTVTDSWYQAEHWTVSLDGKKIGETHEDGFKNNLLSCSANGDECIAKGFSHGSFLIPKGSHSLEIEWTDGPLKTNSGGWWTHGYGVYRFDKLCSCGKNDL